MSNIPVFNLSSLMKERVSVAATSSMTSTITRVSNVTVSENTSNRCCKSDCKKKLALSDFACKCEKRYCSNHRTPELHSCTYDFNSAGMKYLSTILVKTSGDKLKDRL